MKLQIDCSNQGECALNNTLCVCNTGFATFPENSEFQCNYKQIEQWIVVLFHILIGYLGLSWFILGYIWLGILTIFLSFAGVAIVCWILGLFAGCIGAVVMGNVEDSPSAGIVMSELSSTIGYFIGLLASLVFWIIALIIFIIGDIPDSNGVPMNSW